MRKVLDRLNLTDLVIVTCIILSAFAFRLYDIDKPLTDFHSWRQADTAAVARNFVRNGFDLLKPRYDDISPIQSGHDNPQGYRFVEFPLYNAVVAAFYKVFPFYEVHVWGRIVSTLSSLVLIGIIYYLTKKEAGRVAAAVASLVYSLFPFFVYYSRVVLPETMAVMFAYGSILTLYLFAFGRIRNPVSGYALLAGSAVFMALAILIKPTVVFLGLADLYLILMAYRETFFRRVAVYLWALVTFVPFLLWRYYIRSYPEGVPASDWLFTSVNTAQGLQNIFFRPAFFRWIFFERINNLIMGGFGAAFLIVGVFVRQRRLFLHILLLSSLLYLFVFQGGNVQHEYYQTLILPALAIFTGIGAAFIVKYRKYFINTVLLYPLIAGMLVFSIFISYLHVKDYYSYDYNLVNIARIVNTLTSPSDKIVTDTTGDTTLLYLADRKGAPAVYKDLHELNKDGYAYFVTMNGNVINEVRKVPDFAVVFENDKFALFKL